MPKATFKMTYSDAKSLMDAAINSAMHHKVPGAIAIVDSNGNPVSVESLDDTMSGASKIAIGPTKDLEKVILEGRTPMLVLDGATSQAYVPLKGGYPIVYKNETIGAIAVAGTMDAEMDEVVALEALENKAWKFKIA